MHALLDKLPIEDPVPAAAGVAGVDRKLVVEGLTIELDGQAVVSEVGFSVRAGEVLCLLGPSGCGKTSTLRAVAGLIRPALGRITIDGRDVTDNGRFVAPEERGIGMVFQDHVLFPHLTVAQNIGFGLDGWKRDDCAARVAEVAGMVGLGPLLQRFPNELSGGEQQRVALARALAPGPSLMLMDEPFAGLDGRLRDQVRTDAILILKKLGAATLLVTHDPQEAMQLGDRVAVMRQGRIVQIDTPEHLYHAPVDVETAAFFSCVNRFAGVVENGQLATPLGAIPVGRSLEGERVEAVLRPHAVRLAPAIDRHEANAVIGLARYIGEETHVESQLFPEHAHAPKVCARQPGLAAFKPGDLVRLSADPKRTLIFRKS